MRQIENIKFKLHREVVVEKIIKKIRVILRLKIRIIRVPI